MALATLPLITIPGKISHTVARGDAALKILPFLASRYMEIELLLVIADSVLAAM